MVLRGGDHGEGPSSAPDSHYLRAPDLNLVNRGRSLHLRFLETSFGPAGCLYRAQVGDAGRSAGADCASLRADRRSLSVDWDDRRTSPFRRRQFCTLRPRKHPRVSRQQYFLPRGVSGQFAVDRKRRRRPDSLPGWRVPFLLDQRWIDQRFCAGHRAGLQGTNLDWHGRRTVPANTSSNGRTSRAHRRHRKCAADRRPRHS